MVATMVEVLLGAFIVGGVVVVICLSLRTDDVGVHRGTTTHGEPVFNLSVIDQGKQLWLQRGQTEVAKIDLQTGETTRLIQPFGLPIENSCVSQSGEISLFAVENYETLIYRHNELVLSERETNVKPTAAISTRIALSSNGRVAVRVSAGKYVRRWDISNDAPVGVSFILDEPTHRIALDSTGDLLLVASGEGVVSLVDSKSMRTLRKLTGSGPLTADPVFNEESGEVAIARGDTVALYDVNSGQPHWTVDTKGVEQFLGVAISPNGKWITANGMQAGIHVIDAWTGQIHRKIFEPSHMRRMSFSSNSQELYCGCKDGTVRVWSMSDGRELSRIHPFEMTRPTAAS